VAVTNYPWYRQQRVSIRRINLLFNIIYIMRSRLVLGSAAEMVSHLINPETAPRMMRQMVLVSAPTALVIPK